MHVRVAGPVGYLPDPAIVADAERIAAETGGSVLATTEPIAAFDGADVVATDTWVSMGQEAEKDERLTPFEPFAVTAEALRRSATRATNASTASPMACRSAASATNPSPSITLRGTGISAQAPANGGHVSQ